MSIRDKVTLAMLGKRPIPKGLENPSYPFYYNDYKDNLFCPMGESALNAYAKGSGSETKPTKVIKDGVVVGSYVKMASVASSSAMTFNLLGNDGVTIKKEGVLPCGVYTVEYEKKLRTVNFGNKPANLDAFLSDKSGRTAIFCEMKMFEWLNNPSNISNSYFLQESYFAEEVDFIEKAKYGAKVFIQWANMIKDCNFKRYDAWQMFKHTLAIYNHTSFKTQKSVNILDNSFAGVYEKVALANVVNEFPSIHIKDVKTKRDYEVMLNEEREEAKRFIQTFYNSGKELFAKNCLLDMDIIYLSAEQFANAIDMSSEKKEYLKRYY